ncbi:MAG TPA: hypothetical protein PLD20_12750 [Blastocatellia bacterium]|nr:hypothetical protein [Blastocatellia bacterium]HMX28210.1 hypothetical protein [Blastocatellia bacterium]HMZ18796.1 hypothetical protein [Blastocatellia bacterium]HNG29837.1 hypothetical protein [Blastocatellia bacterium]
METNERNMEYASGGQYGRQVGSETFNRAQGQGESTFSQMKSTVADKLHAAADSLHQTAGRGTEETQFTRFGHQAADWLDRSADYVSRMEPAQVRNDIESGVRKNPGRSLLIAGAVGLVLGGLLRRR